MKAKVLGLKGEKLHELELPDCFNEEIRKDIIQKAFQAAMVKQPFSPELFAGMKHSASGKIRHARRKWKTAYGYGISRVPRKIHTRRGSRFFWVGATISSARGGRQAHPPKVLSMLNSKRMNKKEKAKALLSAIAATGSLPSIRDRYSRLAGTEKIKFELPIILDSKITELGTKEFRSLVENILGDVAAIAGKEKRQRAGKGKARGRKYKSSRGMLIVTASDEKLKSRFFDASNAKMLNIGELAPAGVPGRLVAYTEKAVSELGKRFSKGGRK